MSVATLKVECYGETQVIKVTRVDMSQKSHGVCVWQYEDGWTAGTDAADFHINETTTLEDMIAWFKSRGWTVVSWGYGARAWWGPMLPVRTRYQIKQLRRELATQLLTHPSYHGTPHPLAGKLETIDLAFYL